MAKKSLRIPLYVDASTLEKGLQEVDRLVRERATQTGRGRKRVDTEVFGPTGERIKSPRGGEFFRTEKEQQGQAITRAQSYALERIMRTAELEQAKGRLSEDQLLDLQRMTRLTGLEARSHQDINNELQKMLHETKLHTERQRAASSRMKSSDLLREKIELARSRGTITGERASGLLGMLGSDQGTTTASEELREILHEENVKRITEERKRRDIEARRLRTSRMTMGMGGVATALTMPISGFTPLTIAFAGMSGPQYAIGAAAAVFVKSIFSIESALVQWRKELVESAVSLKMISKEFKRIAKDKEILQGALGGTIAQQQISFRRIQTERFVEQISSLAEAGRVFEKITGVFTTAWNNIKSTMGYIESSLTGIPLKTRLEILKEAKRYLLQNAEYQSSIIKPEDLYRKIATAAMSRGENIQKQQLDALNRLIRIAEAQERRVSDPPIELGPRTPIYTDPLIPWM